MINSSGICYNAASVGPSLAMVFGPFNGGPYTSEDTDSSDRCKLHMTDALLTSVRHPVVKSSSWRSSSTNINMVARSLRLPNQPRHPLSPCGRRRRPEWCGVWVQDLRRELYVSQHRLGKRVVRPDLGRWLLLRARVASAKEDHIFSRL